MSKITFTNSELKIFKRAEVNINQGGQHNPFGINYKGKVLAADIFESSKPAEKISFGSKIINKGKLYSSAVIGGFNSLRANYNNGFNRVVNAIKNIPANIGEMISRLNSIEVIPSNAVSKIFSGMRKDSQKAKRVNELMQMPVDVLADMLRVETEKPIAIV